jgi:hypothetical protein
MRSAQRTTVRNSIENILENFPFIRRFVGGTTNSNARPPITNWKNDEEEGNDWQQATTKILSKKQLKYCYKDRKMGGN